MFKRDFITLFLLCSRAMSWAAVGGGGLQLFFLLKKASFGESKNDSYSYSTSDLPDPGIGNSGSGNTKFLSDNVLIFPS